MIEDSNLNKTRMLLQSEKHQGHIGGAEDEGPNDSFTSSDEAESTHTFQRKLKNGEETKALDTKRDNEFGVVK